MEHSPTMSRSIFEAPRGVAPINIKGISDDEYSNPPPALPPPRFLEETPSDYRPAGAYGSTSRSIGSAFGSISSMNDDRPAYAQRKMTPDEGYESFGSSHNRSLPGFGALHSKYSGLDTKSYDKALTDKLNPIRTIDNSSRRPPHQARLPPLLTGRPNVILEESDRYMHTPCHSAISPRSGHFHSFRGGEYMSPDGEFSPRQRSRRHNSGSYDETSASTRGSYDAMHDVDMDEEPSTRRMDRLRLVDDAYSGIPVKRRASSPPVDDITNGSAGQNDALRRKEQHGTRISPSRRVPLMQAYASSTAFSNGGSSIASLNSYGRRSPGAMSPGGMSPITSEASCNSPFQTPRSLDPSPRSSLSRPSGHSRSDSRVGVSPRKLPDGPKLAATNGHKIQDFFMCECCPKKPKKFDTLADLQAHESEKQYGCSYCGNRFKNKNEAERHQNSLHVRRHSWSCKAMESYGQAFHESTARPGQADTCGYCGKEFDRSGPEHSAAGHMVSDKDWQERIQHLTDVHKFRECNSSKKFYRADHFRQHLKHSHSGSSGKWTNMLENACMIEEEPPQPVR